MDGLITVLDKNIVAKLTIDDYISFIWTERYNQYGDFEIYVPLDKSNFSESILTVGENGQSIWMDCYARIRNSRRAMILEQFRTSTNAETGKVLIITGRSLESILLRRIVWGLKVLKGNLQNAVKSLINDCIINPSISDRRIDNFIFVDSEDPNVTSLTINAQYTGDVLYDVINAICVEYGLGFKVELTDDGQFAFSLYCGADRSYEQNDRPYVVFSPKFENLLSSEFMESNAFFNNVTLVGGEGEGIHRKYVTVGSASGIDRRELFTDARDLQSNSGGYVLLSSKPSDWSTDWTNYYQNVGTQSNPEYEPLSGESAPTWASNTYYTYDSEIILSNSEYEDTLRQRGQEKLSENKRIRSFDGNVDPFSMYVYGEDFFIGDIVEVSDGYGHNSRTRVTEYIRCINDSGFSAYPSFSLVEEENNDNN